MGQHVGLKAEDESGKRLLALTVNRTRDLQIFSLTLSQLSYQGMAVLAVEAPNHLAVAVLRLEFRRRVHVE